MSRNIETFCNWYINFPPYPQPDKWLIAKCKQKLNSSNPFNNRSIFKASMVLAYYLEWPVMDVYKHMKFYFKGDNREIKENTEAHSESVQNPY